MIKAASGTGLTIYANTTTQNNNGTISYSATGYPTKEQVQAAYPTTVDPDPAHNTIAGKIDASRLTSITDEPTNEFHVQCSSNSCDTQMVTIDRMNARILGVANLNVSTEYSANLAIDAIAGAVDKVSAH